MTIWTWLWIIWLLAFIVIETITIIRKDRGDTLSEHVWKWFSLKGGKDKLKPWQAGLRFAFLAFWAWLTIHFLTGGRFL